MFTKQDYRGAFGGLVSYCLLDGPVAITITITIVLALLEFATHSDD
jgi:hypothetical protein